MTNTDTNVINLHVHNAAHLAAGQKLVSFMLGAVQWPIQDAQRLADWLAGNGCQESATEIQKLIAAVESES